MARAVEVALSGLVGFSLGFVVAWRRAGKGKGLRVIVELHHRQDRESH